MAFLVTQQQVIKMWNNYRMTIKRSLHYLWNRLRVEAMKNSSLRMTLRCCLFFNKQALLLVGDRTKFWRLFITGGPAFSKSKTNYHGLRCPPPEKRNTDTSWTEGRKRLKIKLNYAIAPNCYFQSIYFTAFWEWCTIAHCNVHCMRMTGFALTVAYTAERLKMEWKIITKLWVQIFIVRAADVHTVPRARKWQACRLQLEATFCTREKTFFWMSLSSVETIYFIFHL